MSFPPVNPDFGYSAPPPKPASTLKWSLFLAAAILIILAVIAGVAVFVNNSATHPNLAKQTVAWRDQHSAEFMKVATDLDLVANAAKAEDVSGLRTACGVLAADVDATMDVLPSPDQKLTDALEDALVDYYKAATTCQRLTTASEVTVTTAFLESGNRSMENAVKIMNEADRRAKE